MKTHYSDENSFLSQVVLQYAKTIVLLKVRHLDSKSIPYPYMSSLTMPATQYDLKAHNSCYLMPKTLGMLTGYAFDMGPCLCSNSLQA